MIQKLIDHSRKDGYNVHSYRKDDSDNSSITSSDDDSPHPKGRTHGGVRKGIHGAVPTTSTPLYNKRSHHLHCYASYYTFFYASEGGGAHLGRERESSSDDDDSDAEDRAQKRSDVVIQCVIHVYFYIYRSLLAMMTMMMMMMMMSILTAHSLLPAAFYSYTPHLSISFSLPSLCSLYPYRNLSLYPYTFVSKDISKA